MSCADAFSRLQAWRGPTCASRHDLYNAQQPAACDYGATASFSSSRPALPPSTSRTTAAGHGQQMQGASASTLAQPTLSNRLRSGVGVAID
jgi:hypothetical protein